MRKISDEEREELARQLAQAIIDSEHGPHEEEDRPRLEKDLRALCPKTLSRLLDLLVPAGQLFSR